MSRKTRKREAKPFSRAHKIEMRIAIMGMKKSYIASLWGISPTKLESYIHAKSPRLRDYMEKELCEMLGVKPSFLYAKNWDDLNAPFPKWFRDALKKEGADLCRERDELLKEAP